MQKNKKNKETISENRTHEEKHDSIFNYDLETKKIDTPRIKQTKVAKKIKSIKTDENYIGIKETPVYNEKTLKKLKRTKRKEFNKKQKEILKAQKQEEKRRKKSQKKIEQTKIAKKQKTEEEIKRIRRTKKIAKIISILVISIAGIMLLLLSPIFNINEIVIEGNSKISTEEIISLSKLENGMNIFKIPKTTLISNVKENAYIENVKIKRNLPSKISIMITEREVSYLLEIGNSYAYIDDQGYILEISNIALNGKTKIIGYVTPNEEIISGRRLNEEDLDKLNTVAQIIKSAKNISIDKLITSINIQDNSNFIIYLETEKKTAYLGDKNNIDTKMLYIKKIIELEKNYEGEIFLNMDLRTKRPYFKQKV